MVNHTHKPAPKPCETGNINQYDPHDLSGRFTTGAHHLAHRGRNTILQFWLKKKARIYEREEAKRHQHIHTPT